jgi:hypothetical protein
LSVRGVPQRPGKQVTRFPQDLLGGAPPEVGPHDPADSLSSKSPAAESAARGELERATEVQQSLLPKGDIRVDGYDVAGIFRPSRNVGGDFTTGTRPRTVST